MAPRQEKGGLGISQAAGSGSARPSQAAGSKMLAASPEPSKLHKCAFQAVLLAGDR